MTHSHNDGQTAGFQEKGVVTNEASSGTADHRFQEPAIPNEFDFHLKCRPCGHQAPETPKEIAFKVHKNVKLMVSFHICTASKAILLSLFYTVRDV